MLKGHHGVCGERGEGRETDRLGIEQTSVAMSRHVAGDTDGRNLGGEEVFRLLAVSSTSVPRSPTPNSIGRCRTANCTGFPVVLGFSRPSRCRARIGSASSAPSHPVPRVRTSQPKCGQDTSTPSPARHQSLVSSRSRVRGCAALAGVRNVGLDDPTRGRPDSDCNSATLVSGRADRGLPAELFGTHVTARPQSAQSRVACRSV